jgi:hypothetical protein
MDNTAGKRFGVVPLFDPAAGMMVRAPLGDGPGWWAGAPGATFDALTDTFYLVYRQRQPRELGRGIECRIAASENGIAFKDIWALPKSSLNALSLERCSLCRGLDGVWRLYLCYVSVEDRRWRIGLLEADEPDAFDLERLTPLLTADDIGADGVKDPSVFIIGRMTYLIASYATHEADLDPEQSRVRHATGDIFNTGLTRSRTGAAISGDGRRFQWIGDISPMTQAGDPDKPAWDSYCRRIGSVLPLDRGGFLAFYDGGASVAENYEERTGLAITFDLREFYSLSPDGPALVSPYSTGCLRYVDALPVGRELFYYYEMARPDGSHELRVSVVERD